jgi:hypothetical protein
MKTSKVAETFDCTQELNSKMKIIMDLMNNFDNDKEQYLDEREVAVTAGLKHLMKKKIAKEFQLPPIGDANTAASDKDGMGLTGLHTPSKKMGGTEDGGSQRAGSAERLQDGLDGLAKRPWDGKHGARTGVRSEVGGGKGALRAGAGVGGVGYRSIDAGTIRRGGAEYESMYGDTSSLYNQKGKL